MSMNPNINMNINQYITMFFLFSFRMQVNIYQPKNMNKVKRGELAYSYTLFSLRGYTTVADHFSAFVAIFFWLAGMGVDKWNLAK